MALLQSGDHGDLVIGTVTITGEAILKSDEAPHWYNFLDPEGTATGEIRLVIRHLDLARRLLPELLHSCSLDDSQTQLRTLQWRQPS